MPPKLARSSLIKRIRDMNISAKQLCEQFAELVISSSNTDTWFSSIDGADSFHENSLAFINDASQLACPPEQKPAVVITGKDIADSIDDDSLCLIVVSNVKLAQALIKQYYFDYDASDPEWDALHDSAVIHPSAKLGNNVRIGPNTVIGKNTVVGDNTGIRANCVIEHDVVIGDNCIINNLVNIGYGSLIGNRVIIRPGVIIGNEGFGFGQDDQRRYHRVPHTGIVEIQDDVQIGSNCNIDRGTYGTTLIARGVKIDSLCHIAHNVVVNEDALFVSQTGIAGSCTIGKRVIASGQTGILDHKKVADDAVLLHRCGVIEDIPHGGKWAGKPAKPFREYVRNLSLGKRLDKLKQRVDELDRLLEDES